MYEDKTLICKECGAEFVFTAGEQEFYAEKGFTNEPQRCKAKPVVPARCSTLSAPSAESPARFRSSPEKTVRSTAAIALQPEDKSSITLYQIFGTPFGAYFFCSPGFDKRRRKAL